MKNIEGRFFLLGDQIDTDQILPGYAMSYPPEELKRFVLAGSSIPDFASQVKPGDIIIAGENFGCGSSREQAPLALKSAGVGAVIAVSYARIFRRNAINIGLPVMICQHIMSIASQWKLGDELRLSVTAAELTHRPSGATCTLEPLPGTTLETLQAGGLINKVRIKLAERE